MQGIRQLMLQNRNIATVYTVHLCIIVSIGVNFRILGITNNALKQVKN